MLALGACVAWEEGARSGVFINFVFRREAIGETHEYS